MTKFKLCMLVSLAPESEETMVVTLSDERVEMNTEVEHDFLKKINEQSGSKIQNTKKNHLSELRTPQKKFDELSNSKKSQRQSELDTAYSLIAGYQAKADKCMNVLVRKGPGGTMSIARSQVIKLLAANEEVGKEYKRLCLEVIIRPFVRKTAS